MIYFTKEITNENNQRNAGGKARKDCNDIFQNAGYQEIILYADENGRKNHSFFKRLTGHFTSYSSQKKALLKSNIKDGDMLLVQYPVLDHTFFQASVFKKIQKRGAKLTLLIHDLSLLRHNPETMSTAKKLRLHFEEKKTLLLADYVISHNAKMTERLVSLGVAKEKIIDLQIFDYLIDDWDYEKADARLINRDGAIIIAGNLARSKCGYVYDLPNNQQFNLYGVNYEENNQDSANYKGSYLAEELPYYMEGSFGLVWDGTSSSTCSGDFGNYLRINNPHKTSLYIASEIPVVIWKEAALADFVKKYNCGIVVDSLEEINAVIKNMSDAEYEALKRGTKEVSAKLREGCFLKDAINKVLL